MTTDHAAERPPEIHGLMAEFESAEALLAAAEKTHAAGYRETDAYAPFPIHGLAEALGFEKNGVPLVVLIGGTLGCVGGFMLQYWARVIDYPVNIAGRPYNSWQAFIPVTFECTILLAAFAAVFGMLALNGLPQPYHPVFNVESFALASRDKLFLCIEAKDPLFDHDKTRAFLESLGPKAEVADVPL